MKIINGAKTRMGRLASHVAKEALKGEEVVVVNCRDVLITGSQKNIQTEFHEKTLRIGSGQRGPKIHKDSAKIVKRAIRGMMPNHREGRGRDAFKKIKCYKDLPKEFEGKEILELETPRALKQIKVQKLSRK